MKNYTLNEWLEIWWNVYKLPRLAEGSIRTYSMVIRLYFPQWLKEKEMNSISAVDLDMVIQSVDKGRMRKYVYQTLSNVFNMAYKKGMIDSDIIPKVERVKYKKRQSSALLIPEREAFLKNLKSSPLADLFLFYFLTGVRRSEALSIRWEDIDFIHKLIHVKGTKTETSDRFIILTDEILNLLNGIQGEKKGFLFEYKADYVSKQFKKLCPNHHLHELRHTYITILAEKGVSPIVAKSLVGHSDLKTTMNIYTHPTLEFISSELKKIEKKDTV